MAITSIKTGSSFTNLQKYDSFLAGNPYYVPPSFESIASATGSGTDTVTFSSIPSTYASLQLRIFSMNAADGGMRIRLNGDTSASNYTFHQLRGNGTSAATSGAATGTYSGFATAWTSTSTTAGLAIILDLLDYTSTSKYKTARLFNGHDQNSGTTTGFVSLNSGLWLSTSAVNSITVLNTAGNYGTGTSIALYGIRG